MKTILILTAIISVSLANLAKADAFYSDVYVGMSLDDAAAYYFLSKPKIAASYMTWGTAHTPPGQRLIDFRTKEQERRVQVIFRLSDGIIVSVSYYNIGGQHFENSDLKKLLDFQRSCGAKHLVSHLYGEYGDETFEVTTAEEYKLEQEHDRALTERTQQQ